MARMPLTFLAALIAALLLAAAPAAAQVPSVSDGWGSGGGQTEQRDGNGRHPWSGWDDDDGGEDGDRDDADAGGWDDDGEPAPAEDPDSGTGGWIDGDDLQPPGIGEDPIEELLPPAGARPIVKGSRARLGSNGVAYAPSKAPMAVKRAIWAANQLKRKPYKWGGGHGRWKDSGYDCSGSTSYVLHAAGLLSSSMVSGTFARWGKSGKGRWITIYANRGHVFMVIAGMRFDTSPYGAGGRGPRWRVTARPAGGFKVRHPAGF